MRLLWLQLAEEDLDSIYHFYSTDKSIKAAIKLYNDILDATEKLIDFPLIAAIEPKLSEDEDEYRALVVRKHFKIIYFIEEDVVYIAAIWDCRQNPKTNESKIK